MNPIPSNGDTRTVPAVHAEGQTEAPARTRDAGVAAPSPALPAARQLPPGGNKISRISQHTKGIVQDVTSWVELKMKLAQIEVLEQMDARLAEMKKEAVAGMLAAVGGFFLLIATALGIAAILVAVGLSYPLSYFLGFFLVALAFLTFAALTHRARTKRSRRQVRVDDTKLMPAAVIAQNAGNANGSETLPT